MAAFLLPLVPPAAVLAETDVASVQASIDAWRADREALILEDFVELLSIPNVATNRPDMERNAEHIVGWLEQRGFSIELLRAGGAPYVYAELAVPGAAETVLIYAHFDGQPVQEDRWAYPPFSPRCWTALCRPAASRSTSTRSNTNQTTLLKICRRWLRGWARGRE